MSTSVGTQRENKFIFGMSEESQRFPGAERERDWLCDFAFAVDMLAHMNVLNMKLQGKDQVKCT